MLDYYKVWTCKALNTLLEILFTQIQQCDVAWSDQYVDLLKGFEAQVSLKKGL